VFLLAVASATGADLGLVVAVSQYPSLPRERQLEGPKNDAAAMVAFLTARHSIPRHQITILADQFVDADGIPTRSAILSALSNLKFKSHNGDRVWIYFAGHGSQQPQPSNAPSREPDGLDEIFLPIDIGRWDGRAGRVQNAIVDDEIGTALEGIREQGADVVAIFDTCHAADSVRGRGAAGRIERPRAVPRSLLGIPRTAPQFGNSTTARRTHVPARATVLQAPSSRKGELTAYYASAAHEYTPELLLPRDHAAAVPQGLFTFTLLSVWAKSHESTPDDTIREIRRVYKRNGRRSPTPSVERSQK